MRNLAVILSMLLLVFIGSCKKTYRNEDIQEVTPAIVVEGMITDLNGPYQIKISKALGFNDKPGTTNTAVSKAKVVITEDGINAETLVERHKGTYETVKLKGKIGSTYQLRITLTDGTTYESAVCRMQEPVRAESIYAEQGTKIIYVGENLTDTMGGMNIYADIAADGDAYMDIQFKTTEEKITYYRYQPTYYLKGTQTNDVPILKSTSGNNLKEIKKQFLGFIPRSKNILDTITEGWLTSCFVFSFSADAYTFYTGMYDQLNGTDRLFDPAPVQLLGNVVCTSDAEKICFGYFNVASVVSVHALFKLNQYDKEIVTKPIASLPYIIPEYKNSLVPKLWVWSQLK